MASSTFNPFCPPGCRVQAPPGAEGHILWGTALVGLRRGLDAPPAPRHGPTRGNRRGKSRSTGRAAQSPAPAGALDARVGFGCREGAGYVL